MSGKLNTEGLRLTHDHGEPKPMHRMGKEMDSPAPPSLATEHAEMWVCPQCRLRVWVTIISDDEAAAWGIQD